MKLNEYASSRKTWGSMKVPRSVQQSIPIDHIYEDGIWQSGDVFSMMWLLSDINYAMLTDKAKENIQNQYAAVYDSLPTDCWAKFCVVGQRLDEQSFRKEILYHREDDELNELRKELNHHMVDCVQNMSNVIQQKYLIVSTVSRKEQEARERLMQVRGNLIGPLSTLKCTVQPVTCAQRLQILHNFFRIGEESNFSFDWRAQKRLGNDFRDLVAPDNITFKADHIEFDSHFAKCMSIMHYPMMMDDRLISTLLRQVPYIVLSIDVQPIEPEDALSALDEGRMKVDADKVRFNRKSVDNLDFTASIPHEVREQEKGLDQYQTDMAEDQQMFLTLVTVAYYADSMEDLAAETAALKAAAANMKCRFTELKWQQENAFNTAMPYGLRRIENMRTMVTKNVAAMVPFSSQEIIMPGGVFYGTNLVSGNLIVGDRTKLVNGNGIILGTSGGGKSAAAKLAMIAQMSRNPKAHFYIVDPENEYTKMVEDMGGVVVNISVNSETHFNPLEFHPNPHDKTPPYRAKSEFVLSLYEQIVGGDSHVDPKDRTLIDKALHRAYEPLIESNYKGQSPTLSDLCAELQKDRHPRAQEIALAMDIFATGSMNAFAQQTNVDMGNHLICFNIQGMGDQLKTVAMISMLEYLETCVMENERNDPKAATWVYFDEMYLMLRDQLSAHYLEQIWKRFRKYNAYATGITQNVQDCLDNPTAYAMLANSEFVCILRQTKDIDSVVDLYGLSDQQRSFLLTAQPGQGILKMGNSLIQFENIWGKDTLIYKMITTKPGEM